jgi:urease accessory protein
MHIEPLPLLRLMQLADSAVPIGTAAHSFGLESMAAEKLLGVEELEPFLRCYLEEAGLLEAVFCRTAHGIGHGEFPQHWAALNQMLSAFKPAREIRTASITLGRRFLQLALTLGAWPPLRIASETDCHFTTAFGLVGGLLCLDEQATVLACLHQLVAGLISACQRAMPLGQHGASRLLWDLKPALLEIAVQSRSLDPDGVCCFMPLVDIAGMRHPTLPTRLFMS